MMCTGVSVAEPIMMMQHAARSMSSESLIIMTPTRTRGDQLENCQPECGQSR